MQSGPQWSQKQEPGKLSVCRKMAGALGGWNRADGWEDWGARRVRGRGSQGSHVVKSQKIHAKQVAGRVRVRGPTLYPWSIVGPRNQQALILWAFPQARNPLLSLLLMQREKFSFSWVYIRCSILTDIMCYPKELAHFCLIAIPLPLSQKRRKNKSHLNPLWVDIPF